MSAKVRKRPPWISGTGVAGKCEPCDWNWDLLFCKDIRDPSLLSQLSSPRVFSHMSAMFQIQVTMVAQQGLFPTKLAFQSLNPKNLLPDGMNGTGGHLLPEKTELDT